MRSKTRNNLLIGLAIAGLLLFGYYEELLPGMSVGTLSHGDQPLVDDEPQAIAKKENGNEARDEVEDTNKGEMTHAEMVQKARKNVFPGGDKDHLHGAIGFKKDGSPGIKIISPVGSETMEEKREHHKGNCFNLRRSDGMPLDRELEDVRHPKCRNIEYPDDLPIASVIFVFYNEPLSPLFRSVHSVLNRTPTHLLHEIVLVDDFSDTAELAGPLDDYVKLLPKVKLVRLKQRSGLMTARTAGARASTGEVAVFLDSHIEVTEGWLEPLLARIREDRKHVVMPIIDSIDADSFQYYRGGIDILSFSWRLGQTPLPRRRTDTEPMPSVIMAGGLFAIDRKLFHEIGEYDPEMQLYGGEEMEISFRIWQCGMTLECVPCSRVGHIFRSSQFWQGQVYKVPGEVIVRNKLRAAEVWMDEYKDIVFDLMAPAGEFDLGPLDYMRNLRRDLKCKSFQWLLDNVFPEMYIPFKHFTIHIKGEVRNPSTNACFDTLGSTRIGSEIGAYPCHKQKGTQHFYFTDKGVFRIPSMDFNSCLDRQNGQVSIWGCQDNNENQIFVWDPETKHLSDQKGKLCLEVLQVTTPKSPFTLKVSDCAITPSQAWQVNDLSLR